MATSPATREPLAEHRPAGLETNRVRDRAGEVYAAALRLFREKGYHATSMQDIAEAVGLYKGSLYHYIGSKQDLLVQAFERAMGPLLADLEQVVANTSLSPSAQLRAIIRLHVAAVADNLDALTVYLTDWKALEGEALTLVAQQRERFACAVQSVLERGVREGTFRMQDEGIGSLAILGMCNWSVHWYHPDGRLTPDQIADHFADIILNGLCSPTSNPPPRLTSTLARTRTPRPSRRTTAPATTSSSSTER